MTIKNINFKVSFQDWAIFKTFCVVLDTTMQKALEEALQDWINKKKNEVKNFKEN